MTTDQMTPAEKCFAANHPITAKRKSGLYGSYHKLCFCGRRIIYPLLRCYDWSQK